MEKVQRLRFETVQLIKIYLVPAILKELRTLTIKYLYEINKKTKRIIFLGQCVMNIETILLYKFSTCGTQGIQACGDYEICS